MLNFTRKKRVVDIEHRPLSSCSQHSGKGDSLSLSYLVHSFLEQDTNGGEDSAINDSDWDRVDSENDSHDTPSDSPSFVLSLTYSADPYKNLLIAHVSEATQNFAFLRERNSSLFRRHLSAFLRERRHDAAVCETARDSSNGSHEFIDVIQLGSATWRYFLDLNFREQFEIARPTRRYSAVLDSVPGVFVGGSEELKRTISTVCGAARRCFRSRGLPAPQWRKNRFMQSKWFGPCRRTANPVPRSVNVNGVSCRLVGFDDVVLDGGVVVRII